MRSLLKQTWDWTLKLGKSRYSLFALFILLFVDASFFPFPTTVIFLTMSLLYPLRTNFNALIATIAMASGSVLGYGIGHFLWLGTDGNFTGIAQFFFNNVPGFTIEFYQYSRELYLKWSYGILFLSIILPIPYQFYSITAGAFDVNLLMFSISTFFFQGLRFFLLAFLVIRFGEGVKTIFHKNLKIIAITTSVIVIAYIVAAKFFQ